MCTKYWLVVNRLGDLSLSRKSVIRLTDHPDMTLDVYRDIVAGLEIYTRPLVFTSSLSVRASENCYWLALSDE